jgi:uncharacterized membrane protein (UPF0136 family)
LPVFREGTWEKLAPSRSKKAVLALIIIYATFASIYNQIVLNVKSFHFGLSGVCLVLSAALLWALLVFALLMGFDRMRNNFTMQSATAHVPKHSAAILWIEIFLIIMIGYSFWMIACFPANMSFDSIYTWQQAMGEIALNNAHPILYTLLMRASTVFIRSPFMLILLQSLAQAAIWAFSAVFLLRCGAPRRFLYRMAIIIALAPTNGAMAVTLWKDVIFSTAILALVICLAMIIRKPRFSLLSGTCFITILFWVTAMRHNGIAPAIVAAIVLSAIYLKGRARLIPIAGIVLIVFFVKMQSSREFVGATGVPLIHAIASVFYYNGDIDDDDKVFLTQRVPEEKWISEYNPYSAAVMSGSTSTIFNEVKVNNRKLFVLYLKCLVKNPLIMLRHHLSISDVHWAMFQGMDKLTYNYRFHFGIDDLSEYFPTFKIRQIENPLTHPASRIAIESSRSAILDMLLWRGGIYIVLYLLLAYFAWLRNTWRINLVITPVLGNFIFMCIINVAPDYRYAYPVFLVFPFILLFYIVEITDHKHVDYNSP